jgi:tRNA(fMet)-specific endonuclease VapC
MPTHLLDTSVFSQPLRKTPVQFALDRWSHHGDANLVACTVCEGEVLFGIEKNASEKLAALYASTLQHRLNILQICSGVAGTYAKLRAESEKRGQQIADNDLWIASVAHHHNLIVATLNVSDFSRIHGLTIEDWSQPL